MWPLSGTARQALAQSHTMASLLQVLHAGQVVYTLVPYSGTVNAQAGRAIMRNLGCTVIDPTGALSGSEVNDLLSPYDAEVMPFRGVVTAAGTEWTPLGVFGLTGRNVLGDGRVEIDGQDRAMIYQGGLTGQLAISGSTPVETAIYQLLSARRPNLQMYSMATGYTAGPLLYSADINVWSEAQKLAQSAGAWLYHDRVGGLHLAPLAPRSRSIVARFAEGDGVLLDVQRKENSDTIHNVVVAQSTNTPGATAFSATVEDDDPNSPTYAWGTYGRRVLVVTNQNITSVAQAQQVASTQLILELGRTETVTATIVCNPALDPTDMVCVNRPSVGLAERTLVVDQVDCSLSAKDSMSIQFRKYLLTEDGQTLDTPLAVA